MLTNAHHFYIHYHRKGLQTNSLIRRLHNPECLLGLHLLPLKNQLHLRVDRVQQVRDFNDLLLRLDDPDNVLLDAGP